MNGINSHVARIVHPPGWPHAAAVRYFGAREMALTVGDFMAVPLADAPIQVLSAQGLIVTMARTSYRCDRCERMANGWSVWAPEGYALRPCDAGPCPGCDMWTAPHNISATSGIDAGLIRLGETVAWHELADRELLEVARFELMRLRDRPARDTLAALLKRTFDATARRDLSFALTEAAYRNLLPKPDDLRVAWDLALTEGRALPGDDERLTLADVWALHWYTYRERLGAA